MCNTLYICPFKSIRLEEMQRHQALAEQKRLEQEREERERKRALTEIQQIKDRHLKEKLQQFSQTEHGQKLLKKLDEDVSLESSYFTTLFWRIHFLGS